MIQWQWLGSLTYDTKIDKSGFEKGLGSLENVANTASKSIKVALGAVTTAITGIGTYAIKVGSEFEESMSKVQAISGATKKELEELTEKAKEMGAKTKFSATESAEAFQYMAMAGWKTEDMLNGIEGIMNLAAASGEDLASVSDIVTDALTAFGLQAKDSGHFADVLAKASSNSNTNVGLMGETFKYVAPLAGSMKYSIEDTAVAIGLMANAGIKGSQAGTALRSMLTRLVKPPKEAAQALTALNISATNSDGTMKPLSQTLQELRKKFSKLSDSQKSSYAASIAGQEAMSGMLAIVNASDSDFDKLTASINNADGASKEMADTMNDNLKGAITLLKSNLESVGIKIYEQIQEPLKNLVKYATEVLSKVSDKIPEIISKLKEMAPTLIALGAGLKLISENGGITEKVLGLISNKAKTIPEIFGKVGKSFSSFRDLTKSVMEGISTTFSGGIFEKIGKVFSSKLGEITKKLSGFAGKFLSPFQALGGKMGSLLAPVKKVFDGIILKTSTFAQLVKFNIGESFNQAFPNFSAGISKISGSFGGLFSKISPMLQNFLPMFTKAFNITAIIGLVVAGLGLLQGQFGEQINQIATIAIEQGPTIITNLVNGIVSALPQLIKQGSQLLQTLLNVIIANLPAIIQGGIQIICALVTGLAQQLPTLIPMALELILTLVMGLLDNIDQLIDAGINLIIGLAEGLINAIPILIEKAPEIIAKLIMAIANNLPKIIETGITLIIKLAEGLIKAIPQLVQKIPEIIKSLVDGFGQFLSNMWEVGKDLVNGIWDGIKNAKDWLIGKIKEWCGNILDGIKAFFGIHSPSKVMRDEIGKFIPQGLAVGIEADTDKALKAIDNMNDEIYSKMQNAVAMETASVTAKASVKANNSMLNVIQANFNIDGSIDIDGQKAGRILAPNITKTIKVGGLA